MKKFLVICFWVFVTPVFAQHAVVHQLAQQVNYDSLVTYVKQLTGLLPIGGDTIKSRLSGSAGNELAAEFIKQKLTSWNVPFEVVDFSASGKNIIARIEGRRPSKVFMLGAHYDAVGTNSPWFFYPGADDNASGTAAVLEAVRVCAGMQFPVTLHFAFWDEEEQLFVGSRASAPTYPDKLAGYINLDMIAYDSNNDSSFDIHTRDIAYSMTMAAKIFDAVALYDVPLKPRLVNPGESASDHSPFWQNGMSAVSVNEEYSGDFTPHWHKLTDSITYFNLSYFHRMSRFATTAILHLAMDTSPVLAVNDPAMVDDLLHVYPNPSSGVLHIDVPAHVHINDVRLFNMLGEEIPVSRDGHSISVPTGYAEGMYWISVSLQSITGESAALRKKVILR